LSKVKISENLIISNLLTDSIENAAKKKRDAFNAQAKIAGVGDAFAEYQDEVYNNGSSGLIQSGAEAKTAIDNIFDSLPPAIQDKIVQSYDNEMSDLEIYELLKSRGYIK